MQVMRRPYPRRWPQVHQNTESAPRGGRPCTAMAPVMSPLPFYRPAGGSPWSGMDPSDPATYVRPWNPRPGMIAFLNFDGAAVQGNTDMGGVWSNPARFDARAAGRPKRRPR